ncbi:MAG: hypothetical protein IJ054_01750 [Lachnospiraceae bacterium]|nr:hypothetical protein [Lachnospiraceae bacterium]MBQ9233955.1 hypothetical protein [Lachnospiraceae bacterium]
MEEKKLNDDELDMVAGGLSLGHIGGNERRPDDPSLSSKTPLTVDGTAAQESGLQEQIVGGKNGPRNPFA